jgi:hypothetical protein
MENKNENARALSNVFSEIEKIDLSRKELDDELTQIGFDPEYLVMKIRDRVEKLKANPDAIQFEGQEGEFDPLMLAARKTKRPKKAKKRG